MKIYNIWKSDLKTKKFVVVTDHEKVYFGAAGYSDYTIHKDDQRLERYIARHKKAESWKNLKTAGFWSRWILWNKPTLTKSIQDTESRFKIKIKKHNLIYQK